MKTARPTNSTIYPADLIGKLLVAIAAGCAGGTLLGLLINARIYG